MPRMTSLQTIQQQILVLEEKAERLRTDGKPGIAQARAVIVRFNLKPADIRVAMRGRSKVKPKFRNPDDTSQTWAGRGLRPRWLVAALKQKGKKLEDFAV